MGILKDTQQLVQADIISTKQAEKIIDFYKEKKDAGVNRLFVVFGILGSILVGLGIILIIAHNWDSLSKLTKTILCFVPLIIGQLFCGFTLVKKRDSKAWVEGSAAFLFFAIGASISLVSQTYHIPGDVTSFILTWMLLSLPIVYIMPSSVVSIFYLIGITYYTSDMGYDNHSKGNHLYYWVLLLSVLPHYILLIKNKLQSNFVAFHNWIIPISLTIVLGTVADDFEELMFIAYISMFSLFYIIGNMNFSKQGRAINNGYRIIGSLGVVSLLLSLSFDWFWDDLINEKFIPSEIMASPEFIASAIISVVAIALLFIKQNGKINIKPISLAFILFIAIFIIGLYSTVSIIIINIAVFTIGLLTIRHGAKQNKLGVLNFGLLTVSALITCRFFDKDLSFVMRGILFVLIGVSFFITNYIMLKRRKSQETSIHKS